MPLKHINISIPIPTAIIIFIAAVLLWIFAFKSCGSLPSPSYAQNKRIDSLTQVISNLNGKQTYLDGLIVAQELQLNKISQQIDSTNIQLQETRKQYDIKIKNIAGYSNVQLEHFFTARYK